MPGSQPGAPPAIAPSVVDLRKVVTTWWPLAASWILMALELPLISAVMARLADPKISLAAYGGVVFPISMLIEAPIIMLLAASTALCRDEQSYLLLRRFMTWTGAGLTLLHFLVAATPLYHLVVGHLIKPPEEIRGPARIGLLMMTPWTWAIAYRRLQQGVLIRFGRSHLVGLGTLVRLGGNVLVLGIGYAIGSIPGIVVGTAAVVTGVVGEAVFAGFSVRPLLRQRVRTLPKTGSPLRLREFLHFYIPLAMTPLISLVVMPMGSAAMSRMPRAIDSLAVWPVINGFAFLLRSIGIAFNEVVVSLLDQPGAVRALRRFAVLAGAATSATLVLVAATPLASLYMGRVSALAPALALLAVQGLWLVTLMPGLGFIQSWHQGILVQSRRTRGVTEAVVVYLAISSTLLIIGIAHGRLPGLFVALGASVIGNAAQVLWLWRRSRQAIRGMSPRGT